MPRLTKQDIDAMSLPEVRRRLLEIGDDDVSSSLLSNRMQVLRKQEPRKQEPEVQLGRIVDNAKNPEAEPVQQKPGDQIGTIIDNARSVADESKPDSVRDQWQIGTIVDNARSVADESKPDSVPEQLNAFARKRLKIEQRERGQKIFQSQGVEFKSPELPEAKQVSGLVFVDQPREERPLLVSSGTRIPAFSAAEQSAQEAYNRRVRQKQRRAEEIWLDQIRQTILNLGQG